jgi:hypothetical protein
VTTDTGELPDGSYVTWQGRTYRGSVGPRPGTLEVYAREPTDDRFTRTAAGGWRRTVPSDEAVAFRLTTRCRWRGELFTVQGRTADGRLQLAWTGTDQVRAEELGLTQVDRYAWGTTAPETDVTELHQERRELPPTT